jgi:uncharacterized protein (TIGR02246 family)
MRFHLAVGLVFLAVVPPGAQAQQSSDEVAVRAVITREWDGWTGLNAKQVASSFTDDAIWQNPFGVRIHGRSDLEKFLTGLMARPGYQAGKDTKPPTILDVRMTSPTTATVWSDEKIEGLVNDNNGRPMAPRHSYYLEALVKKDGVWKICDAIVMDIIPMN